MPQLNDYFSAFLGSSITRTAEEGFHLNKFKAEFNKGRGAMRPNLFMVSIDFSDNGNVPKWVTDSTNTEANGLIPFFCVSAPIPGVSLALSDIQNENYGALDRRPYQIFFPDITLQFILDQEGLILNFLHTWMKNIINYDRRTTRGVDINTGTEALPWQINYKNNYQCKITITTYDSTAEKVHIYELWECYPSSIGDVELDWNNTDTFSIVPVTFQMRYFTKNSDRLGVEIAARGASVFEFIARTLAAGFVNIPHSLLRGKLSVQDAITAVANYGIKQDVVGKVLRKIPGI